MNRCTKSLAAIVVWTCLAVTGLSAQSVVFEELGWPDGDELSALFSTRSCGLYALSANKHILFHSMDRGETWEELPELPKPTSCLVELPDSSLIIGTSLGCYRSTDKGYTWTLRFSIEKSIASITPLRNGSWLLVSPTGTTQLYRASPDFTSISLIALNFHFVDYHPLIRANGDILVRTDTAIYASSNLGDTWEEFPWTHERIKYVMEFRDTLYVLKMRGGWMQTPNNGKTYSYASVWLIGPTGPVTFLDMDSCLWVSNGREVRKTYAPRSGFQAVFNSSQVLHKGLIYDDASGQFAIPTQYGIYTTSDDGANWFLRRKGMTGLTLKSLYAGEDLLYGRTHQDLLITSTDDGHTWDIHREYSAYSDILFGPQWKYLVSLNGLYRAKPGTLEWEPCPDIEGPVVLGTISRDGKVVAATGYNKFWLSEDYGNTFSGYVIDGLISPSALVTDSYNRVFALMSPNLYYVNIDTKALTLMCDDLGTPLQVLPNGAWLAANRISHDDGNSWRTISLKSEFEPWVINTKDVCFSVGKGMDRDWIVYSTDYGATWEDYGGDFDDVREMSFDKDGRLVVRSRTSLWRSTTSTGIPPHSAVPEYRLANTYPNPVGAGVPVTLSYEVEQPTPLILHITDLLGREVIRQTLENSSRGQNTHTINTAGWQPGMYFYTLRGCGETVSGKLVVR